MTDAPAETPTAPAPPLGPVDFRPIRMRKVAVVLAPLIVVSFAAIGIALHGKADSGTAYFQAGDQAAMIGLGIFIALGILMFARPRVRADHRGLKIRNIVGQMELPWGVIRAVRFDRGSAWASVELHDDELVPVHAIQANDKQAAVDAVRALRKLLAAAETAEAGSSDRGSDQSD